MCYFYCVFPILSIYFGLSQTEKSPSELQKIAISELENKIREVFADPIQVSDCSGRIENFELNFGNFFYVGIFMDGKNDASSYFEGSTLVHRIETSRTYIFKSEIQKNTGKYKIERIELECSALDTSQMIHSMFLKTLKKKDFSEILNIPYKIDNCGEPDSYELKDLVNVFFIGWQSKVVSANFEAEDRKVLKFSTKWETYFASHSIEFTAIKNETTRKYMIFSESRDC
ncbi:unnamed protein product [Caenorhabditis angaria]|uniref:Uncharacterized protein n=1 Tax=Caenorhabditis angaria TaxID=860376 RepID=A0A9P1IGW1_9PELO|nr:unnamed protein product [Caenorhabditis angaria]